MDIIDLIIKEKFLIQIIAGTKKKEEREIRPKSFTKYYKEPYDDAKGVELRNYDAIQFYAGYNKDRKAALVEIKSSQLVYFEDDETGKTETYTVNGEEYFTTMAEYTLGRVLNKNF